MLNKIRDYFYDKPGRLASLGKSITLTGVGLLVAAAWGNYATGAINVLPTLFGELSTAKTLGDIYPDLPLWWVPESGFGLFVAFMLVAIGLVVNTSGRWIDRLYNMR